MNRKMIFFTGLIVIVTGMTACAVLGSAGAKSTSPTDKLPAAATFATPVPRAAQNVMSFETTCEYPLNWYPYQVQPGETADNVASRFGMSVVSLLQANCLSGTHQIVTGAKLYVPAVIGDTRAHTILPLGISAFQVEPMIAQAGQTVQVTWQGQGPVTSVRLGRLYHNQFIEEIRSLPASGTWDFTVPSDGQESVILTLRVSDGQQEIEAQTAILVQCGEPWFFSPSPLNCPAPFMMTTFIEQHFERGTLISIPAMSRIYMLLPGQAPQQFTDTYTPGMALNEAAYLAPAGLRVPSGAVFNFWRQVDRRDLLGYAIEEPISYSGMIQRSADPNQDAVYLLASSGVIYQIRNSVSWGIILPQ